MSHLELGSRRITSIPRTSLDVLREIGRGSLPRGARRMSREPIAGEADWSKGETNWCKVVAEQNVFQRPPRREKARPEPFYEKDGKIEWETEVIEDHNGKGDLGIILKFAGIDLTEGHFLRGRRNYGSDAILFYSSVRRAGRRFLLLLLTWGDIFEAQVVPRVKDVDILFQDEIHLPQYLPRTHNPTSMTISQKNGLVVVGYKPVLTS